MPEFRTWTPDEKTSTGTIVHVKRACNGCGFLIGDVTEAELDAGMGGVPLPDVMAECPRCRSAPWPAALVEIARLRAALLEEQTVHAKTMDNFEAAAESWLEERTRLLDRYARLDVAAEHLRTSRNGLMRELAEARVTIRSLVGEPDGGTG